MDCLRNAFSVLDLTFGSRGVHNVYFEFCYCDDGLVSIRFQESDFMIFVGRLQQTYDIYCYVI